MILQVAAAEPGVADLPVAALLDELAGQPQVRLVAGLPVELHQGGLHDRVAVQALLGSEEFLDQGSANRLTPNRPEPFSSGITPSAWDPAASSHRAAWSPPARLRRAATAAWIMWPAQYSSWLNARFAYRGLPVTWTYEFR